MCEIRSELYKKTCCKKPLKCVTLIMSVKLVTKIESPTLEALGHSLAGATAGAFALCILYPLDQIKVRKAVESQSRILTLNIIIDDFIHFRLANIMDIYRGLNFGILEQFLFNGVYFFFYQILKSDWKRKYSTPSQPEMPWLTSLIRGSIAGLLTQLFTTPLKVIQLRKQTAATKEESELTHIIPNILETNGITGFWSGMKASVILVVNPAIVQLFYGKIRKYLVSRFGFESSLIDFFAGALSKAMATMICYPLVRIKMNLQVKYNIYFKIHSAYLYSIFRFVMIYTFACCICFLFWFIHDIQAGSDSSSASVSPQATSPRSPRSPLSLINSNPKRAKYRADKPSYQNGVEEDRKTTETINEDNEYNVDIDNDDNSDDEKEKNGMSLKKRVQFYKGPDAPSPRMRNKSRASMSDIFNSTIKEKGIFGLYSGLGPKLIHASLTNAITFASKEKFVIYTFAMMLYLQNKFNQKKLQKMTQIKQ